MQTQIKKVVISMLLLVVIFMFGILGYYYIEEYSFINSLYMTFITLSTVGFREVIPLTDQGKIFTCLLIFAGVSGVIYSLGHLTTFFIEGEMKNYLKGVKMKKKINAMKDHYIIVGCGRTGKKIIEEFISNELEFVIIEKSYEEIERYIEKFGDRFHYIIGDATDDENLKMAGIEKAKVILSVLATDAENLFITLSSRELNKNIKIVTRVIEVGNSKKLKMAGADIVISPLEIESSRLFATATQSNILSFLDIMSNNSSLQTLKFASVEIKTTSDLEGKNLKEAMIPQRTNLIVIGIEKKSRTEFNPMSHTKINAGDKLLVLGSLDQINSLNSIADGSNKKSF
ncbi:potassium channel family protein [Ilyobacter polytropus]|uniref:TrkA-N domain protein n=1 Tax=Ilyobacter polytropus (strain ATCC 51220 / DSM 2926 / LMG 16218 / CuHBu1) TaxID=572544 RepID=E3H8E0_ILYPC|nr:potassium channel protein [Ilyobacter polytropus]ADO82707.1 TrkA-N domain protein [Ilyobacter polytropus DSM 2926]